MQGVSECKFWHVLWQVEMLFPKTTHTIADSLQNYDFVVEALNEVFGSGNTYGVMNLVEPVAAFLCAISQTQRHEKKL